MTSNNVRFIDPNTLTDIDQCDEAMIALDSIICEISTQIDRAIAEAASTGVYADRHWMISAKKALKSARGKRNAVQLRKGQISRTAKQANQARVERLFMDTAKRVLPAEQIDLVWREMDRSGEQWRQV